MLSGSKTHGIFYSFWRRIQWAYRVNENYFWQKEYLTVQVKVYKIVCLQGIYDLIIYVPYHKQFIISNLNIISLLSLILYLFINKILFFHFDWF